MTRYWDGLGWADLGTLELTALPSLPDELWRPALEAADAILVAGGNSGYLSYWAHHTQFAGLLPGLLEKAVYVGVSAGSCLLTPAYHYVDGPLYAIDDQTALAVADGDIRVVSEGDWLLFNAEPDQEGS